VHDPGTGGIRGVGLRVPNIALRHVHKFQFPVAVDIAHHRNLRAEGWHHQVFVPTAGFAPGVDVEPHARFPGETAIDHVRPAIAREVSRKLHPVIARVFVGRIGRQGFIDLAMRGVVRPEIDVWTRHDVHHAVLIEIGGAGTPGIIEIAQPLHPEVVGNLLGDPRHDRQVFVGDVFKLHVSGSADIEREGTVVSDVVFCHSAGDLAAVIQKRTNDIRVQKRLHRVPFPRAQARVGSSDGQGGSRRQARPIDGRAWTGGCLGVQRRRDAHLSSPVAQLLALELPPLGVECESIGCEIPFVERHEHTLHAAFRCFLGAHQQAGLASGRAPERCVKADVLIGVIDYQPSAAWLRRRAGDLAILRAPIGIAQRVPTGKGRTFKGGVWVK